MFIWPLISLPLGLIQVMSGADNRAAGFVTAQVIEYVPPAIAVSSDDVDTVTEEAETMREIKYIISILIL